jgi:hypothetical protein
MQPVSPARAQTCAARPRRRKLMSIVSAILALTAVLGATSARAEGACPNEAFRSELHSGQLPDCRAYELVTPAYKQGAFLTGVFAISENGSHLIGSSFGVFAGTEGDSLGQGTGLLGATYEFAGPSERSGWTASSLEPPTSAFQNNGMFDASADLSTTLWELGRRKISAAGAPQGDVRCPLEEAQPEGVTDFYIERPRGTFTLVGPPTPEPCAPNVTRYKYIGGSSDLSHILFSTQAGFRWPFDETANGSSTLYEYVDTGNTRPSLVGLRPGSSTKLVSDCGTRLGSSAPPEVSEPEEVKGSMYNAISASGERIFFTAVGEDDRPCGAPQPPVDDLFVREEPASGEPPQTVPISCPEGSNSCADANFEGASQDGSKVFFTSTHKLLEGASEDKTEGDSAVGVGTPPNEKKGCQQTEGSGGCNLYEDELNGSGTALTQKLVLVSGGSTSPRVQGVARISEDGSHIYFVAQGKLTNDNVEGKEPSPGDDNLYVYHEGHTSFIATLPPSDSAEWTRADDRRVQVSRDGSLLVFTSREDLTGEHVTSGIEQVFEYNAETEKLVRVSIGENGYDNDNRTPVHGSDIVDGPLLSYAYSTGDSPTQAEDVLAPGDTLTPQSSMVFFISPDALVPQALNDQVDSLGELVPNIYEYRAGQVYLISDGHDTSTVDASVGVSLLGSDASGNNVFFTTSDSLVGQDTDTEQDVYDARVGGGSSPPASVPGCSGEGCRGALGVTPILMAPGSMSQQPELNMTPVVSQPKPDAKTKVRKKAKQKHRKAKKASRDRSRAKIHVRGGR